MATIINRIDTRITSCLTTNAVNVGSRWRAYKAIRKQGGSVLRGLLWALRLRRVN